MKSHWTEYKGKRVFIAEYSHFGDDAVALRTELEEAIGYLSQLPEDSVLVIANVEGTSGTVANANVFKELLPLSAHAAHKRAVIGITGMKRFFLNALTSIAGRGSITTFDTMQQALDWVVRD
jgi:hypothetical protein